MAVTPVLVDHLMFYKKEEVFQVISYFIGATLFKRNRLDK
jgi:hypothetical protein